MISEAQARVLEKEMEWLDAIDFVGVLAFALAGEQMRRKLFRRGYLMGGLNGPSITEAGRAALAEYKKGEGK